MDEFFLPCKEKTQSLSTKYAPLQPSKQGRVNLHARADFSLHEMKPEGDAGSPASQIPLGLF